MVVGYVLKNEEMTRHASAVLLAGGLRSNVLVGLKNY